MMIKGLRIGWRGISSIWLLAKLFSVYLRVNSIPTVADR